MRRGAVVGFAVFAALLAATALPVGALQTNVAVGSAHTNATDFNAATELTNVTVGGTGSAASVSLDSSETVKIDSFESGDISDYENSGNFGTTTNRAFDGTVSATKDSNDEAHDWMYNSSSQFSASGNKTISIRQFYDGSRERGGPFLAQADGAGYAAFLDANPSGDTTLLIRRVPASGGTGTFIASQTITDITSNGWYQIYLRHDGDTITTWVEDDSGTKFGEVSTTDTNHDPDRSGLWAFDTGIEQDFIVSHVTPSDRGVYVSQTHSVDNATTGFINVTLSNASAEVTWLADTNGDGTFETTAASSTFTTTANHTLDLSGADSTDWRVNVTFSATGDPSTAELHDEGVQFTNNEPMVDNSTGSPTGELQQSGQTLSAQINDTQFGQAQGDTVTAVFSVDGESVGTDTLTANGTAQVSHTFTGGSHTWSVTVNDDYGLSNASQTFSVESPGNVTIREEQEPHNIVNDATATVVISGSDETVDRQTVTDGNVSLAGLPTDQDYAVVVNATGYHPRTILVEDVFEQADVFVLNESRASIQNTFVIEDRTGNFPPGETNLLIEKAINRSTYDSSHSGGYQWLVISGDRLGADQSLVVDLEQDGRYRLVAENQDSDRRVLGEYSAASPGVIELRIGNVEVTPDDSGTYAWSADYTNSSGTKFVKFQFNDPETVTSDLRLVIHEYGNETNEIENSTHAGPFGTFSFTEDLSALGSDAEETDWVVEFTATRDGEEITGSAVVGRDTIGTGVPVAPMWLHVGSVGLLILISGLVGGLVNPGAGAATVASVAGVLWYMGMLPAAIGGGAIALALLVSAGWILATQGGSFR